MLVTIGHSTLLNSVTRFPFLFISYFAFRICTYIRIDRGKKIYQSTESLLAFDQFKERIKSIHQLTTNALKSASREVWNCRRNKYASGCVGKHLIFRLSLLFK